MLKSKKKIIGLVLSVVCIGGLFVGCDMGNSTDSKQAKQTATLMKQADNTVGMPSITNFYEKKTLKKILEDCDNSNLVTYSYIKNDMTGKFVFLGQSIGYGISYGTEYTNPQYIANKSSDGVATLPQPDPNGLYKAENVSATWVMLVDPKTKVSKPVYVESELTVAPYKLPKSLLDESSLPSDY